MYLLNSKNFNGSVNWVQWTWYLYSSLSSSTSSEDGSCTCYIKGFNQSLGPSGTGKGKVEDLIYRFGLFYLFWLYIWIFDSSNYRLLGIYIWWTFYKWSLKNPEFWTGVSQSLHLVCPVWTSLYMYWNIWGLEVLGL